MKEKWLLISMILGVVIIGLSAYAGETDDKATLKEAARAKEVEQELAEPDGASIKILPNGEWQLFGLGTGIYDFNESDDLADARQEATLKAKSNIAKVIKERLTSSEAVANISEKRKTNQKDSDKSETSVSKEQIKKQITVIVNSADEIVRGLILLEENKIPKGKEGGEIRIKVGVSSKTQKLADKIKTDTSKSGTSSSGEGGVIEDNKPEKRKAKTDF